MVDPVAIRPIRSVTMASADSNVKGSNEVGVWLRFRETLDVLEVEVRIRIGAGVAPCAGVDTDRSHEGVEVYLTGLAHSFRR